jgi:hypothetical protein
VLSGDEVGKATLLHRDLIFILDDAATEFNGDANSICTDEA